MRGVELNLASRPFRNNTPIWVAHALLLAAVVGFSAWNARTAAKATENLKALESDIGSVQRQLAELDRREEVATTGARVFDLKTLQFQADRANDIILRRGLSWTRLFNTLEQVVPYEVRMTTVRPIYGDHSPATANKVFAGTVPVDVEGVAQSFESFLEFERSLIVDPHFANVEPIKTETSIGASEVKFQLRFLYDPDGRLATDRPDIPHFLDAAKRAAEEGGEAPPDALKGLP